MLAIVLALASAIGYGGSDFAAGLGATLGGFGLYLGFRYAPFSVAGPVSAVGTAGFSVLAGLLLGERPSGLALTGIVLALPAIVGVSASAASELWPVAAAGVAELVIAV